MSSRRFIRHVADAVAQLERDLTEATAPYVLVAAAGEETVEVTV
jgi:hypothetical protein